MRNFLTDPAGLVEVVRETEFWEGLTAAMAEALARTARGAAVSGQRQILRTQNGDGLGVMAGIIEDEREALVGVKLVTLPARRRAGAPSHPGSVLLMDAATGEIVHRFDADTVTALRTAATTAAVTKSVRPAARRIAVVGTGTEARSHLRALGALFPAASFVVWGRDPKSAAALVGEFGGTGIDLHPVEDIAEAVEDADVVTSVTSARSPLLSRNLLGDTVHVNAIGASVWGLREWEADVFEAADLLMCDDVAECARQSQEVPQESLARAVNVADHLDSVDTTDLTVFKSVGLAVLDVAAAAFLAGVARGHRSVQRPVLRA